MSGAVTQGRGIGIVCDWLEIDGSYGEGGGQILRAALFLSVVTDRPFRIDRIRAGRPEPGLKRQHLSILKALTKVARAEVTGVTPGSAEVSFRPGRLRGGQLEVDLQTAGSIPLFLQTLLPVCLVAERKTRLRITGGTDVRWGPTIDWVEAALVPALHAYATGIELWLERRGFYPRGGGQVELRVTPRPGLLQALREGDPQLPQVHRVTFGTLRRVEGVSVSSRDLADRRVAERQRQTAARAIRDAMDLDPVVRCDRADSHSPGSSITLWAVGDDDAVLATDGLGARGKRAELVGAEAADDLVATWRSGAAVDRHLTDHLVPWLGLCGGELRTSEITDHIRTSIWVTEQFLGPRIHIDATRLVARRH